MKIIYNDDENSGNLIIKCYFNFEWVSNHTTRMSVFDFIFMLNSGSIN